MFSLLDQSQSKDDMYFEISFQPSNEAPSKLAGLSVVEDEEPQEYEVEEVPYTPIERRREEPIPYIEVPVSCKKKIKKTCIENYVVLGLATLLLLTFAVSPPSKL